MTNTIPKTAPTKRDALRAMLSDGQWHHMSELRKVAGWRYGARLLELRRGEGGVALETETRAVPGTDNEFEYRARVALVQEPLPLAPKKKNRAKERIEELARENASLKARLAQLEGGAAHG